MGTAHYHNNSTAGTLKYMISRRIVSDERAIAKDFNAKYN